MIHRQQRRDLSARSAQPATPAVVTDEVGTDEPPGPTAPLDDAPQDPAAAASRPPTVPHQERRQRRDAYDLYAQIYAIRTEGRGTS